MTTPAADRTRHGRIPRSTGPIDAGERESRALATLTIRPAPLYADEGGTATLKRTAVAAADDAPDAQADAQLGGARAFGAICLHWRNAAGANRTSVSLQVWVYVVGSGWVKATDGTVTNLAEATEARVVGVAYRPFFVQVTALTGGAGNVDVYVGPEP